MINDKRLIRLTQKVLSVNTENPPGQEKALADFIAQDMRAAGLIVRSHTFVKGRPNIVATLKGTWPAARRQKEAVLITPHFDTVPIGQGWRYDPYGSQIVNGRIYGRGASDDKGNLACCLEVMRSLKEDGVRLKRDIIMAATVDEEAGSQAGIVPLLEKGTLKPKAAVILDSDENDVIVAQKGLLHVRIVIQGKKAHGAYNWRGVNAIEQAAEVIRRLKNYKFKAPRHRLLHAPTVNIGVIQGGDKVNMVADRCDVSVDVRFMPGMKSRQLVSELKAVVRSVTARFQFIIDDLQQPYEIGQEHPLVATYLQSSKKMKMASLVKGSEGATVITFFKKHRIPAFATGYGQHGTAHTTDEYAMVRTLCRGARVLEQFLKDYDENV